MIMPTVYLSYAYLHMHVLAPYLGRGGYVVVQSLGHIQLSAIPWATVHHVSLSFTISRSLLKLTPIELVVSSNHLILSSTSAPALSLSQHFPKGMLMANRHMKRCSASLISSAVQISRSVVSDSLRPHESQHARPPCPSPTPGVHSDSRPSSQRCHPAISSSVIPFSSCPQSLPASESFPMSQLFA